jgi:hypothetical protein
VGLDSFVAPSEQFVMGGWVTYGDAIGYIGRGLCPGFDMFKSFLDGVVI